jgi:thiamine biosynthesis lipoprotein ApbE
VRLAPVAFALGTLASAALAAEVVRLEGELAGERALIEVAGLEPGAADAAARAGWIALAQADGELRALERAFEEAAGGSVAPGDERFALLERADRFCRWSDGVVSALGGKLFRLWGMRFPAPGRPAPDVLAGAVESTRCDRLALDRAARLARVAAGTEVDLMPFELGWAVDRAVTALASAGAANVRVALGGVERGTGAGPDGRGWRVTPPRLPGAAAPLDSVYLRDRATAVVVAYDRPIDLGGDPAPRFLDLRKGRSSTGVLAVVVVTEVAADAQALGWAMFAIGAGTGQQRLGNLRPEPSVLWALGSGEGEPLLAVTRWSAVPKR